MRPFPRLALVFCLFLVAAAIPLPAQDNDVSLGDLARSLKKAKPAADERPVIDNDNLPVMMDKAEAERLNGKPVFSIDPAGKTFRMTSPDGTCSLSFDARAAALIKTPYVSSELPPYELAKLDAEAAIHEGVLEVQLHNSTGWEIKEIVVGVTQLNPPAPGLESARFVTAFQLGPKAPDSTSIYHLKVTASAEDKVMFKADVSEELGPGDNWRWALISARGVPPAAPVPAPSQAVAGPAQGIVPVASVQQLAKTPPPEPVPPQPAQVPSAERSELPPRQK